MQDPARHAKRVAGMSTVTVDGLLYGASALVEGVAGERDDMERIHDRRRGREFLCCSRVEAREAVHGDDLDLLAPLRRVGRRAGTGRTARTDSGAPAPAASSDDTRTAHAPRSTTAYRASAINAPAADIVDHSGAALEHRTVGVDALSRDGQTERVEVAEGREIGDAESSVEQVEVLQMGSVRTSILEDLDPYPRPLTAESPLQPHQ